jgi:CHAD domain-containing protein
MTFHILQTESLSEGLKRIAREQIGIVIASLEDPQLSDAEKIHRLRARCKKMRGLLRLPGPVMGLSFALEDARFRDAGKRLGQARDDYVQAKTLASVREDPSENQNADGDEFSADAALLEQSLLGTRRALAAVDGWALNTESFYDIAPGFAKTFRKGADAWVLARHSHSDENFHRLRKWTKYHWYQVRILERVNKKVLRERRVKLQVLGEVLGAAHDLAVLHDAIAESTHPHRHMRSRVDQQKRKLYTQALKISRKVYAVHPDDLVADMSAWWADWHHREPRP